MNAGTFRRTTTLRVTSRTRDAGELASQVVDRSDGTEQVVNYGTGGFYGDTFVTEARVLNALSSATWDLFGGTDFTAADGSPAAMRTVEVIEIWVASGGDTSGVRIGGAASNCWPANFADVSDMALIKPGGPGWVAGDPYGIAVTSTAKDLKVENLGATGVTLSVYIAGSKAVSGVPIGLNFLGGLVWTYP